MLCKICGAAFEPIRPNQIYCSATCRTQAGTTKWWTERKEKRPPATCPTCGKKFSITGRKRTYCSPECRPSNRRNEEQRERENAARRKRPELRTCEWCGKEFLAKYKNSRYCSQGCSERAGRKRSHPDWYGGTTGGKRNTPKGTKRCILCGAEFVYISSRRTFCSSQCKDRASYDRTDAETRRQQDREQYRRAHPGAKTREQLMTEHKERRKATEEEKAARLAITYTCEICGRPYHTLNTNQKTCSTECSKRLKNIHRDHRIPKGAVIDRNISLASLYERDKGACHICGLACDYNDYEIVDGVKKIGNLYPTIDHVIPLSRGGLHEWENVKLAHRICNSIKSADVREEKLLKYCEEKELKPRASKPFDPRKKVTQATKDGQVVAVYESTAEAERQTGLKQRGIQKAARGDQKTYAGFIWSYV